MFEFEKSYQKLLSLAKAMVVNTKISLMPEELVSEAYLHFHKEPFDFSKYKKRMADFAHSEKRRQKSLTELKVNEFHRDIVKERYCPECKETLPMAAFSVGKVACKSCRNKALQQKTYLSKPADTSKWKGKRGKKRQITAEQKLNELIRAKNIINNARQKVA